MSLWTILRWHFSLVEIAAIAFLVLLRGARA